MDRLRAMEVFIRTVELGSLSAAARDQATTQPTVSKLLGALEKDLGVRLMERSTAGLALTDQGQRFYRRAKLVLEEFHEAVSDARGLTDTAAGRITVNAPVAFGQFRLNALVQQFLARYPAIEIELILGDRYVDLVEEGVDVALRLGGTPPPDAVARKVAVSPRLLVATPAYLAAHPVLRHPSGLADHNVIRFAWLAGGGELTFTRGGEQVTVATSGRFRVNNAIAIRDALAMGAGIGLCPAWLVGDLVASGHLATALCGWTAPPQELALIYPSRRYQPLRARLFIDFIAREVAALDGFTATAP